MGRPGVAAMPVVAVTRAARAEGARVAAVTVSRVEVRVVVATRAVEEVVTAEAGRVI